MTWLPRRSSTRLCFVPEIWTVYADIEEIAVEEDDGIYDESGAIMEFSEIDGESEDAWAKRFDNFCTFFDYCL